MGSDLLIAGFPVPRGGLDFVAARQAALALTDAELRSLDDQDYPEYDDAVGLRDALLSAISAVEDAAMDSSRDAGTFYFGVDGEVEVLLTGGPSWGDTPTDEFDDFELVTRVQPVHRALLRATGAQ